MAMLTRALAALPQRVNAARGFASLPACDHVPQPYTGPSKEAVREQRAKHVNPGIFTYYKDPIMVTEGHMQYLYDETGRRYLDMFGGIVTVSVGHSHPAVKAAMQKQFDLIQHTTTIYLNPRIGEYAEKLASRLPGDLSVCYFTNSGSEANDLAMMMARLYTGNDDVLALRNAYHGMSSFTMGVTAHSTWRYPVPTGHAVHHAMNPDKYRGAFGQGAGAQPYLNELQSVVNHCTPGKVAAFIAEPIQGVGGTVELEDGYLKGAYEITRAHGGVCIADEVQTGFGRLGNDGFWGFQHAGVMPDIVTMAKSMGNGAPLAAVVTTPEIAKVMSQKIHFNTYGGNPISMAIGSEVLDIIDRDGMQDNCQQVGDHLLAGLRKLQEKHDVIGDVRGKGLMTGVELVTDRAAKTPATAETAEVFEQAKNMGLIIGKGGYFGNCLRIKPPMCITKPDVDFAIEVLDDAFGRL